LPSSPLTPALSQGRGSWFLVASLHLGSQQKMIYQKVAVSG
jgi:hypothetical protein